MVNFKNVKKPEPKQEAKPVERAFSEKSQTEPARGLTMQDKEELKKQVVEELKGLYGGTPAELKEKLGKFAAEKKTAEAEKAKAEKEIVRLTLELEKEKAKNAQTVSAEVSELRGKVEDQKTTHDAFVGNITPLLDFVEKMMTRDTVYALVVEALELSTWEKQDQKLGELNKEYKGGLVLDAINACAGSGNENAINFLKEIAKRKQKWGV